MEKSTVSEKQEVDGRGPGLPAVVKSRSFWKEWGKT